MSWLALRRRVAGLDPLAALAADLPGDRFYLEHPARARARVGIGGAARLSASGAQRFGTLAARTKGLLDRVELVGDAGPTESGPQVLGGFAFADEPSTGDWADFEPASFVLPELLLVCEGSSTWLTAIGRSDGDRAGQLRAMEARLEAWRDAARRPAPNPGASMRALDHRAASDSAPAEFVERVERALRHIARGELEKVVVARSVTVIRDGGYEPLAFLQALRGALPECASYLVSRNDATFFGASPERLLQLRGHEVETAAVAGTAPRGRSPESDRALARALLESKKEQAEHAIVLRFLKERLGPSLCEIRAPESPELMRLEGLQHLRSPVSGRIACDASVLAIAGALHPTPATGGAPSDAARAWLAEHEGLDRGWFAGPLGWCDAAGNGDLWVALRSGLLRGNALRIFAGAGIVDGSDPSRELDETRLKLNTLFQRALEV